MDEEKAKDPFDDVWLEQHLVCPNCGLGGFSIFLSDELDYMAFCDMCDDMWDMVDLITQEEYNGEEGDDD